MNTIRRFSRRAWLLHAYLIAALVMLPSARVNSYWTDSNQDGVKEWVGDPPAGDSWWDLDSDGDSLTNAQEAVFGSDPYAMDSDRDGLSDLVERDYTPAALPFDPWSWDSNGDGYSDHDAFYQLIQGNSPVVHYPSLGGVFHDYRDADGDGIPNHEDGDPAEMDRDGDGLLNWQDSWMDDAANGGGSPGTGGSPPADSDGDGIPDDSDPFPWGSFWYNGVEYGGSWADRDADDIPDAADLFPDGSHWYAGIEYPGPWSDLDGDGVPDGADPTPVHVESYWYEGVEYAGTWQDSDGDGIPEPADAYPWDSWNGQPHFHYNGTDYPGEWVDRDGDSVPDAADSWPDDPENGADDDNDGLSNYEERTQFFTNPSDVDTDKDWLTDSEELFIFHTNPLAPRSGLASGQSMLDGQLHLGADSDGDGLPDLLEDYYASLGYSLSKNNPADGAGDLDSDGYTNAQAFSFGWSLIANRGIYDQDDDGIDDAVEDFWNAVHPGSMDRTVFDDAVADHDQDGLMNHEEVLRHNIGGWLVGLDPGDPHSIARTLGMQVVEGLTPNDGQFMRWWWDVNRSDYGGVENGTPAPADAAYLELADTAPANAIPDGYELWDTERELGHNPPRAVFPDEDGDGMPNSWEHRHDFDPRDPADAELSTGGVTVPLPLVSPDANDPVFYIEDGNGPQFVQAWYDSAVDAYNLAVAARTDALAALAVVDPDNDGLSNLSEFTHGTHPRVDDTDHDGYNDGTELSAGSDPLSAQSAPVPLLQITGGNGQTIVASQMSALPLEVRLVHAGQAMAGEAVQFEILEGSGVFQDADGQPLDPAQPFVTDTEGRVRAHVMAGGTPGTLLIRATAPAAPQPVAFTANVHLPPGGASSAGANSGGSGTSSSSSGTAAAWMQIKHTAGAFTEAEAGTISVETHTGTLNAQGTAYVWGVMSSPGGDQVASHQGSVHYAGGASETTSSSGETLSKTMDLKSYQAARPVEGVTLTSTQSIAGPPGAQDDTRAQLEAQALAQNPPPPTISYSLVNLPPTTGWSGESAQIRLMRAPGSDISQPLSVTFVKITDVQHTPPDTDPNSPYHPSQQVETKTLTIAANAAMSMDTVVGMASHSGSRSGSTTVRLIPVEIVDANKAAVSKLKVGKMSDTGVLSGAEASATLDIDKDPDRFFIRVPGGAAMGGISVKVSTTDNPDSAYNDNATQIDLQADGGDAISKSLLLVSDDTDDDHAVDGIADDATGDRTHKIQLGGNFKIEEIKIGTGNWQTLGTKVPVPVEKTVSIGVVILRNKAQASGGMPVIGEPAVKDEMKEVKERYAQAGIEVNYAISTVDPPPGVDLSDGLTEFTTAGSPTAEETALLTGAGTATTDDIQVFYVNYLTSSFGEVFREAVFPAPLGENIIASAKYTPGGGVVSVHFNVAHELGHLLKNDGTHPSNTYQIMRGGGTSVTNVLGASKRFTSDEVTKMRGSKHAK